MIECLKWLLCVRWYWWVPFVMSMSSHAMAQDSCEATGVVLGFFNGVQTTEKQANVSVAWLRILYAPTSPNGEPITYELFYNDTQGFADFVETFDQRLHEHGGPAGRPLRTVLLCHAR